MVSAAIRLVTRRGQIQTGEMACSRLPLPHPCLAAADLLRASQDSSARYSIISQKFPEASAQTFRLVSSKAVLAKCFLIFHPISTKLKTEKKKTNKKNPSILFFLHQPAW